MSERAALCDHGRPLLLDLFCGAGGASRGYHNAGFAVLGVDIKPQSNYPYEFIQADALKVARTLCSTGDVAAIHASPPCQVYSSMTNCRPGLASEYPDLIGPTRELLEAIGLPYVIENVPGAPMRPDVTLCGQMFGLPLYRHRLFESNVRLFEPPHPEHVIPASKAGHWKPGTIISVSGHVAPIKLAREAMGIDWTNREELAEAIPPAYTEYVGAWIFAFVQRALEVAASADVQLPPYARSLDVRATRAAFAAGTLGTVGDDVAREDGERYVVPRDLDGDDADVMQDAEMVRQARLRRWQTIR